MDLTKRLQSINNATDVIDIIQHLRNGGVEDEQKANAIYTLLVVVIEFTATGHNQARPMAQVLNNYLKKG